MGDRGNIIVEQGDDLPPVVLYTHWGGYMLPETLQVALAKRWRWDDHAYLTRIIFDTMTEGNYGSETGFGISTGLPDNEHPLLVVDPTTQTVKVMRAPRWGGGAGLLEGAVTRSFSFTEYIEMPDIGWEALGE